MSGILEWEKKRRRRRSIKSMVIDPFEQYFVMDFTV